MHETRVVRSSLLIPGVLALLVAATTVDLDSSSGSVRAQGGSAPSASDGTQSAAPDRVRIPAGTFEMGSNRRTLMDPESDEQPVHRVTLRAFELDRTEVTVAAYEECVRAGRCRESNSTTVRQHEWDPQKAALYAAACNGGRADRATHPMNCVDWTSAVAYCRFRRGRLPTEAEWEYAARGTDGRLHPWGNDPPTVRHGNYSDAAAKRWALAQGFTRVWGQLTEDDDGFGTTAPVGSFPAGASPFGVLDMEGNVAEWTADWYGRYDARPQSNPRGPARGEKRVIRGGTWADFMQHAVTARGDARNVREPTFGFRCAYDVRPGAHR
ncbi:MAG: SUMF1/EgtB/PvdO family nonheme iron enzyme [Polyangiales bacterium]